jgi:Chalcone isomerase-like
MKNLLATLLAALFAACFSLGAQAQPVELEGVKFEPTVQVGGAALQLNGVGLRKRLMFKVYAAGLYVPEKSNSGASLLSQKGPRRVSITLLRNVDAETFVGGLNDGLKANHTEAQLEALKSQIDALNETMKGLGEVKKGDVVFFEFTPDAGTRIVVNGQPKGQAIPGAEFFTAVLRVWVGDKPADSDLKRGLLGG